MTNQSRALRNRHSPPHCLRRLIAAITVLGVLAGLGASPAAAHGTADGEISLDIISRDGFTHLIVPGEVLRLRLRSGVTNHGVATATTTVILPSSMEYLDWEFLPPGNPTTVTANGNTVSLMQDSTGQGSVHSHTEVEILVRVADLADLPEIAPKVTIAMHIDANVVEVGHGSAQGDLVEEATFLYSRVRMTANQGSAAPGDEITYTVTATDYPYGEIQFARVFLYAPLGADIVPGSVTGAPGAVVTGDSQAVGVRWDRGGPLPPTSFTMTYRVQVRDASQLPSDLTVLEARGASYYFEVFEHYSPTNSDSERGIEMNAESVAIGMTDNLILSLTLPGRLLSVVEVDEQFDVRVTIQADPTNTAAITGIDWTPLVFSPSAIVEVVAGPNPPGIPQNFSLQPGEALSRTYTLRATSRGRLTLSNDATGVDSRGFAVVPGPVTRVIDVPQTILKVKVDVDKPVVVLEDTAQGPIPQTVTATVTVTNVFNQDVNNIFAQPIAVSSRLIPPPVLGALQVTGGPFDPVGPNPNPAALGTLAPGESISRTYTLEARADGEYNVEALITAQDPSGIGTLSETGFTVVKISGDIILYFESETSNTFLRNGAEWVIGGNSWRILGTVENLSNDETILVVVRPQPQGNAFYAQPIPNGTSAPDAECAIGIAQVLAPREKVMFRAPVRTLVDGGTRGTVTFKPTGFILNPDDTRTALAPEQIFYKEGSTDHLVRVDVSSDPPIDASVGALIGHYLVGTFDGLATVAEGISALVGLAGQALVLGLSPWDWPETYEAVGDKVAKYLLDIREGLTPADKALYDSNTIAAIAIAFAMPFNDAGVLFDNAVEQRFTRLATDWETGDSAAVAQWWGELTGENIDVVLPGVFAICKLAHKTAFTATRGVAAKAASQAATLEARAAVGVRALKNGDDLAYAAHLAPLFGIDKLSDRLFREFAERWNITIVVRRRGAGVIQKLRTGKFALKPFPLKAKNVHPIDVDWLDFPNQIDEVLIAQPPPLSEVRRRLNNAGAHSETIAEVEARWGQRWDEWYGKGAHPETGLGGDIAKSERAKWLKFQKDGMPVSRNSLSGAADNFDQNFPLPAEALITEQRRFRGSPVTGQNGRPALVANIEDPLQGWQKVTGDIDPMAFLGPDGKILPPEVRLEIYKLMRKLKFQHPATLTWNDAAGRNAYLREFSTHTPNSPAMAAYRPDGRVRATRFDPGKSWNDPVDFRTAARMYFRGATLNLRAADATPDSLDDLAAAVEEEQLVYVGPGTWAIISSGCPGSAPPGAGLGSAPRGAGPAAAQSCPLTPTYTTNPSALVLRQNTFGHLQRWTPGGGWRNYVPSGLEVFLLPQTALAADAAAGTTVLEIHDLEVLGLDPAQNEFFQNGQAIVINPGGANQEEATITGLGSLIIAAPLQFDHQAGELITVKPTISSTTTTFPGPTTTTLPLLPGYPPETPSISGLTPDSAFPLSQFNLAISSFNDPDSIDGASAVGIRIEGPLDGGVQGVVFERHLQLVGSRELVLPRPLLDPGTGYTISARYVDSSGQVSEYSGPFAFTTAAVDPNDADDNGVEDRAEVTGFFDVNSDGIDDSTQRISVYKNAENGDVMGIFSTQGNINRISTLSQTEALAASPADVPNIVFPFGVVGYRTDDLAVGQSIGAFYYVNFFHPGADQFLQYDPTEGFVDLTADAGPFGEGRTITYVDGGLGDLDGVANGRIVDPTGLAGGYRGPGVCSAPVSRSSVGPVATDCFYLLRTAVGATICAPKCICAPKGTMPTTATDALTCLRAAVGVAGITLDCPCPPTEGTGEVIE